MEHLTPEWIAERRKLCDAATLGQWEARKTADYAEIHADSTNDRPVALVGADNDAAFIATARTALPAALDALEAAYAEIARLTAERGAAIDDIIPMCQNCKHCTRPGIATIRCAIGGNLEATSPEVDFDGVLLDDYQCDKWNWRGPCAENAPEGVNFSGGKD